MDDNTAAVLDETSSFGWGPWHDGHPKCPGCGTNLSFCDGPGMRCYNPDCDYDHGNIAVEFKTLWRIKE